MNWVSKLSGAIFALMLISFVVPDAQAGDGLFSRLRSRICRAKCAPAPTCATACTSPCATACASPCQTACTSSCQTACNYQYFTFECTCEKLRNNYELEYKYCMCVAASQRSRCSGRCNSCGVHQAMATDPPYVCPIYECPTPEICREAREMCLQKAALRKSATDPTEDECDECYRLCIDAVCGL